MNEKQTPTHPSTTNDSENTLEKEQALVPNTQASEKFRTARIQTLNDVFRQTFEGGRLLISSGVQILEEGMMENIIKAVQNFKNFTNDNDPHGEHDFGIISYSGETIYWKIDYYSLDCLYGSEDPSDPEITTRVLTIYLSTEH